jgi:hypothetical protein
MTKTFYFAKQGPPVVPVPAVVRAPQPPTPTTPTPLSVDPVELAFWQAVSTSNECESTRAYRRRFPNGSFADLAAISERRLCAKEAMQVMPPAKLEPRTASPGPAVAVTPNVETRLAERKHHASRSPEKTRPSRFQRETAYEAVPLDATPRGPVGFSFGMGRMMGPVMFGHFR